MVEITLVMRVCSRKSQPSTNIFGQPLKRPFFQPEKKPSHAFGIKHSPYLGSLKGDAWGGATVLVEAGRANANANATTNGHAATNGHSR